MTTDIPEELCGVRGCCFLPHSGPHTWEINQLKKERLQKRYDNLLKGDKNAIRV